jgi:hypothetical protein
MENEEVFKKLETEVKKKLGMLKEEVNSEETKEEKTTKGKK